MEASLKKILRGISLELRHTLEGWHDKKTGAWNPGDLERRLNEIGAWGDRPSKPLDEMPDLSAEDRAARRLVDGYLQLRAEAGVERAAAVAEFVRESAYTWANRLFALRCMEARSIIEEVILQKAAYAGRSLVHQRYLRKNPDAAKGEDDGLFAVLFTEFAVRAEELPALFEPKSPAVALRPSVAALKHCVALLSGTETVRGQEPATDEVFAAPDTFGWGYQYWNTEEKDRVFEMVRTKKDAKIQGADIIPATQLYTEPYMVKFLVQNSLGALWMMMYPDSKLCERWEYYVKAADSAPVAHKPVHEITFLDPAEGSGHFHLEAFDLFYAMYEEEATLEGRPLTPREIAAGILNQNLYGIDIDGRSVQIATAVLWMKAKERVPDLEAGDLTTFHEHLVATNIRLPKGRNHLALFLQKHPEDEQLRPALELVFQGLEHADELGALLQIEEPVDAVLLRLKEEADMKKGTPVQTGLFEPTLLQGTLPLSVEDYDKWKRNALDRLQAHFETEAQAADAVQAFFGESAGMGLTLFNLLARRYDAVTANPPYMGSKNMGATVKNYVERHYDSCRRDLFAAFINRCQRFLVSNGRCGMVTLSSWLSQGAFSELRHHLLTSARIDVVVQLGRHAFSEADPPGYAVLFIFAAVQKNGPHMIDTVEHPSSMDTDQQAALLRRHVSQDNFSLVAQSDLQAVTNSPILLGMSGNMIRILATGQTLATVASVPKGLTTAKNERFLRYFREVNEATRWLPYAKGGGYSKWCGLLRNVVDYEHRGARLRATGKAVIRNSRFYGQQGLTYTEVARGSFGLRALENGTLFDARSPGIFSDITNDGLMAVLNSRVVCFFFRTLSPGILLDQAYAPRLPIPERSAIDELAKVGSVALDLKRGVVSSVLTEFSFGANARDSVCKSFRDGQVLELSVYAWLACIDALIDQRVAAGFQITDAELAAIHQRTGVPSGFMPRLGGYSNLPEIRPFEIQIEDQIASHLASRLVHPLSNDELASVKKRLRKAYAEAGEAGGENSEDEPEEDTSESEESVGGKLEVRPESALEVLSSELKIHPISLYWLLKEGIEHDGWRCPAEERRLTEDRFTVLVLRLLGHRWPKQIEAAEPLPGWADQAGVIPLTSGGGEVPLIDRVSERLSEDFPGGNVAALGSEFEEIVSVPLEQWLAGRFFERHISQFKKRPIAWQLETVANRQAAIPAGKGKKNRVGAGKPVFACLVYYQKLDVDLLPKIRTQYVGPLRGGFETEFRTLERLVDSTGDQQARRLQLEQWIDELQACDRLLEEVSTIGFCPKTKDNTFGQLLRQYGINDALLSLTASWLRRLSGTLVKGPLSDWAEAATKTELHPDLPKWVQHSMSHLNHLCAVLGPKPPEEQSFATDPTSKELAPLVCHQARGMVESSLKLGCDRWWKLLDAAVLEPLRQEIKTAKIEIEKIDEELKAEGLPFQRRNELGERKYDLKEKIKSIKSDHDEKSDRARKVRSQVERWACPEAETWEAWLSAQPLFDGATSLDG